MRRTYPTDGIHHPPPTSFFTLPLRAAGLPASAHVVGVAPALAGGVVDDAVLADGAAFIAAHAGAYLGAAVGLAGRGDAGVLGFPEAGTKEGEGKGLIGVLGAFGLDTDAGASGAVGELDSGGGFVAVLSSGAGAGGGDDIEVGVFNN